jgi:hypothetical protein
LNGKLKNEAFKDKKKILQDHGVKLPEIIAQASGWTAVVRVVQNHAAKLLSSAHDSLQL